MYLFSVWFFCRMVELSTIHTQMCVTSVCVCVRALLSVCVNVWWQIEGAGTLWGEMTIHAPVAPAERQIPLPRPQLQEKEKEKKMPWVCKIFSVSVWFSFPRLSFSFVWRLVSHRCLLLEKFCSPALNCFSVTERKRSNLQAFSTPHIS